MDARIGLVDREVEDMADHRLRKFKEMEGPTMAMSYGAERKTDGSSLKYGMYEYFAAMVHR